MIAVGKRLNEHPLTLRYLVHIEGACSEKSASAFL